MGVFNPRVKERFFRSIQSMIVQSFSAWELLLYDDGSSEPYATAIRSAADLDSRILLIRAPQNHGLADALNTCIRTAKGDYIARMDDDDFSTPDRLYKQYRFLEEHPEYQWVGSYAELVDSQGKWGILRVPIVPQARDFLHNSPYIHPSVLFRKEVLIRNGGYNPARVFFQCEDYELFMRLHQNGERGYNLSEPLLEYWEDRDSYRKRTYRRRIREMNLRYHRFQALGILHTSTFFYVLKPLLVGALPVSLQYSIKRWEQQKRINGKKGR